MAVTSSTGNIYSSIVNKNKGIGGLVSGLDTEAIIEALTATTRSRIATQSQQRQLLNWKMTAYRGVSSALTSFQNKYYTYTAGSNNIMSNAFFNVFKATTNSDKVSVLTSSTSNTGTITIDSIKQLATAESYTSGAKLMRTLKSTDISTIPSFDGESITLNVDGKIRTIDLSSLEGKAIPAAFETELNKLLGQAFGEFNVYDPNPPKTAFDTHNAVRASVSSTGIVTFENAYYSYGVTPPALPDTPDTTTITVVDGASLGLTDGDSNRIALTTKLKDIAGLQDTATLNPTGSVYRFTINNIEFTFSEDDSLDTIMARVNASNANVRMSYSSFNDEIMITSKVSGAGQNIVMKDTNGDLLHKLFGAESANGLGAALINRNPIEADNLLSGTSFAYDDIKGMRLSLTYEGKSYTISPDFSTKTSPLSVTSFLDAINTAIEKAIDDPSVYFSHNGSGQIAFHAPTDKVVTASNYTTGDNDLLTFLGFDGSVSNQIDLGDSAQLGLTLGDLGRLGVPTGGNLWTGHTGYTSTTTLQQVINDLNTHYGTGTAEIKDGYLFINDLDKIKAGGFSGDLLTGLFGAGGNSYSQTAELSPNPNRNEGQNAEIVIGGKTIPSSSNVFEIDGITIEVTDESTEKIIINVQSDSQGLVDKVQEWVDEYNALLSMMYSFTTEKGNSDYPPLTDEQKADLSKEEIEMWEEEAKKGILQNDSTLRTIITKMRSAIYTQVSSAGMGLYDIGITTVSMTSTGSVDQSKAGMLQIDKAKLQKAIEDNPDLVRNLFTDTTDGVSKQVNEILNSAISTSADPKYRGTLITIAGSETATGLGKSTLETKIDTIDRYVSVLKTRLENQYNRLWRQFSNLEVVISKLQSQSSWLYDV